MAFDAGAAIGHFGLDTSDYESGEKRINKSNESMFASVFKANAAYDLFKQALQGVINVVKDTVSVYIESEKLQAQTAATLTATGYAAGLTKEAVFGLADSMMSLTTFDDEMVLSAENVMLRFTKIGKDVFPQATKSVLDMATAMGTDASTAAQMMGMALEDPVLGMTRLRRSGVIFTAAQKDVVKQLVATGDSAGAQQVILDALDKKFGGSAAAARDTFGGALKALNVMVDENKESLGKYFAVVGRPFVEQLVQMAKSTFNFLESAEGLKTIRAVLVPVAGAFGAAFEVARQLWYMIKDFGGDILSIFKKAFSDIVGKGNEATAVFTVLGGAVKTVGIGMTLTAKVVEGVVTWIKNLVEVVKNVALTFYSFGDALLNLRDPKKWSALADQAVKTWDAIKKMGVDYAMNIADMVTTVVNEFKTFGQDAGMSAKEIEAAVTKITTSLNAQLDTLAINAGDTVPTAIVNGNSGAADEVQASWQETFDALNKMLVFATDTYGAFSYEAKKATDDLGAHMLKLAQTNTDEWQSLYDDLLVNAKEAVEAHGAYSLEAMLAIQALADFTKEKSGETKDALVDDAGEALKAWQKSYEDTASEVSDVMGRVQDIVGGVLDAEMQGVENAYKSRKRWIEANVTDEDARAEALKKLEEEYAYQRGRVMEKQWKAEQAATVAGIIMNTALAVVKALPNVPLAAIIGGLGAVQLGIALSQPMPDFYAAGGVALPNEQIVVGERGPELVTLGQTSRIVPNDELRFGGGVTLNNNFYGDISEDLDLDLASSRSARRLQEALRSA